MPKDCIIDNSDLVSESEYGDIPLDQAINQSIRELQDGLNNLQQSLLTIIDHDIITADEWTLAWETVNEFNLVAKELKLIIKSFKPAGCKLGLRVEDLEKIKTQ